MRVLFGVHGGLPGGVSSGRGEVGGFGTTLVEAIVSTANPKDEDAEGD